MASLRRTLSELTLPIRRLIGVRLPPRELLLRRLPRNAVGAEIGVWKGDFAADLLRALAPSRLHLIDPWRFVPARPGSLYGGLVAQNQADMDTIYDDVARRFQADITRDVVRLHRSGSIELAPEFDANYFDWIYIDGDHSYQGVQADLATYIDKVRPGGIVAGDDYDHPNHPGVTRAVDEMVATGALAFEWRAGHQYLLRRPSA